MADFNCCHCFKKADGNNVTKCFSCKLSLHLACINLTQRDFDTLSKLGSSNLKIVCNRCEVALSTAAELRQAIDTIKTSLDERLSRIESSINAAIFTPLKQEEMLVESVDRSQRAFNIILANVPENTDRSDVNFANDILEVIEPSAVVSPEDVVRLGKASANRPRLLRLHFKTVDKAKLVLRKRDALKKYPDFKNVIVRDDKTKQQLAYLSNLNNELKQRRENGENNVKIKYVNNVPKIIISPNQDSHNSSR